MLRLLLLVLLVTLLLSLRALCEKSFRAVWRGGDQCLWSLVDLSMYNYIADECRSFNARYWSILEMVRCILRGGPTSDVHVR
jgi:hypothetical protein